MYSATARRLLVGSGTCALVGAAMWAYKSVVILVTGDQPDYWFELALAWFGVSALLLAMAMSQHVTRSGPVMFLGWVSGVAGVGASLAYWWDGDDEGLFGPAAMVMMIATVVLLFLVGGDVRERQLFGGYDVGPRLLAWLHLAAIPLGAVFAGLFGERFLEVGLLLIGAGWVVLALGALHASSLRRHGPSRVPTVL